jgi:eukaryotic-like serine/threonine-protein kinase
MYQHTQVPPPSLHRKNLAIPLDVERAVMKTLEKEPKERFASVQAFAKALEEISKELPIGTTLCTYRGHVGRENSVSWLPDGSYIINPGNVDWVTSVAWSPDGKYVASASRDGTVQIWEALTGNQCLTYRGHSGNANSVAWAPDGTYIASAGTDETVHVWNTITGNNCLTYRGHSSQVNAVAWSHYGKHIASASSDETVQIWDALTGQRLLVCQNTEAMKEEYWDEEDTEMYGEEPDEDTVEDVAWSPDDSHFASASYYRGIQVFNALTGIILCTYSPDWAPDGKRVVCDGHKYRMDYEDGEIYPHDPIAKVLDAITGHVLTTYDGHDVQAYGGLFVSTVAWSPNGVHIASSDHTCSVHIWKVTTGDKVFTYHGHSDNIRTLAWSPDGTYIASGSSDGIIQVWQARELAKFP